MFEICTLCTIPGLTTHEFDSYQSILLASILDSLHLILNPRGQIENEVKMKYFLKLYMFSPFFFPCPLSIIAFDSV